MGADFKNYMFVVIDGSFLEIRKIQHFVQSDRFGRYVPIPVLTVGEIMFYDSDGYANIISEDDISVTRSIC